MHEKLRNYFNKMALLIKVLKDGNKIGYDTIENALCDKECSCNVEFLRIFNQNKVGELAGMQLRLNDLNPNFFEKVDALIEKESSIHCALLLYYMDRWITKCYMISANFNSDYETYTALNDNFLDVNIGILPRIKCNWDKRRIGNAWEQLLENFYFIDYGKLNGMKVINHELNSNIIGSRNRKSLKIAISPLTKSSVVRFSKPYERVDIKNGIKQNFFRVEGVDNEQELLQIVIGNIYKAGKDGANILVFPEMLGTKSMLNEILAMLQVQTENVDIPQLIIFPSIWEKTKNDIANTNMSCLILDGEEILYEQFKRKSFKYKNCGASVYEDIVHDNGHNIINMLHINNIGRVCIIICYDYLDADNRSCIMDNLFPTLVCSPSFSTGSFDFNIVSEKYFDQGCNWVWCNTCSASNITNKQENFDVIGIITTLSKRCNQTDASAFKKIFQGVNRCNKSDCLDCLFYAEIPLYY